MSSRADQHGHAHLVQGRPPVGPGGPRSLNDPDVLEKLIRNAGFADVRVHTVDYVRRYASSEEHFDMVSVLAPPISAALRAAAPEQVVAVREAVANLTARYRDQDAVVLPARALVAIAS